MQYLAEAVEQISLFEKITAQPFIVSLLVVGTLLFAIYAVFEKLGMSPLHRIMVLIPVMLALAVVYFQHGPAIASVLLSVGFVLSFAVTFLQFISKS